jgi:hypothetical protein
MTSMMTWRYVLAGDETAAQAALREVLQQHGFTIDESSADEWHATEGTRPSFLARMAGDVHEPIVLRVRFSAVEGGIQAELHRPMLGVSGMSRDPRLMAYLDQAYRATATEVRDALTSKGVLVSAAL